MIQSIFQIVTEILFLFWDIKLIFGYQKKCLRDQDIVFYGVNALICLILYEGHKI